IGTTQLDANLAHDIYKAQLALYFERNPESKTIFNLSSNDHLGHLIFDVWGHEPLETTKTGKNKLDDDYLETIKSNPVIEKLIDFKKLNKLLSTYVDGILERQIDGIIYTSMLQYGTTSGRYSSTNPNLQNQPRIKDDESGLSELVLKYVNAIRAGFVSGKGYKIVNADYSALEPRCFSHVSGDANLINVWTKGEDIYSRVAIDVFKVQNVSALKSEPNYLGKIKKEFRQKSKVFTLAVPYGAEESRISDEMGVSYQEARKIIQDYLGAYPGLRKYMATCNVNAKAKGQAISQFGRIRHLTEVKTIHTLYGDKILDYKYAKSRNLLDVRRTFKHGLNASKNFPIQSLAASIVNRAMIEVTKLFKLHNIDGYVALQVHDEITCIVREDHSEKAAELLKHAMEQTTKISVPLIAEPQIADNWADAK
ncbi:MAG TPA: DNA polymerase A family protein, partial [Bacteroidia bacterium]